MWWTYEVGSARTNYPTLRGLSFYQARGTGGQTVFVIPDKELVIVLRGDTDNGRNVGGNATWVIAERIVAAMKSDPAPAPRLVALAPIPFESQAPEIPEPTFVTLRPEDAAKLVGNYRMGPDAVARVWIHEGRLFMFFPGQGEGELYAVGPNEFTVRVVRGVRVKFDVDASGRATGVDVQLGSQTSRGTRMSGPDSPST
jgi:hypothetical protein